MYSSIHWNTTIMTLPTTIESPCATLDLSRLSLIVQTVKDLNPTIEQTQEHLELIERVLQNTSGPLYIISDMKLMKWVNIKTIIYLGKGIFNLDKNYVNRIQLHAFVRPNFLLRMLIPLFDLFARLEGSQVCTKTKDEAIDWISLESGIPFYE